MKLNCSNEEARHKAENIRLLLLDVDGVLTDGRLYMSETGEIFKVFDTQDGHGIKMMQQAGITVGIITGRSSKMVETRAAELGIDILYMGREDKLDVLQEIKSSLSISDKQICYGGDDLPDLPVLQAVGFSFTVPAAHPELLSRADCVTDRPGGSGAVREVTDFLLRTLGAYPEF